MTLKRNAGSRQRLASARGAAKGMLRSLRPAYEAAMDLVFPRDIYCLCCEDQMENSRVHGICDVCAGRIDWNLSDPLERDLDMFAFDGVLPCCRYGFYPRRIISGFKLSGRPYAARSIGKLMGERLFMSGLDFDIVAAVPMHRRKERLRGFNQSELLARFACEEYLRLSGKDPGYIPGFMVKTEETASMRTSDAVKRRSLLHTSFSLSSQYADIIRNRKIILADDVVTTGSTADACARILKEAGADRVYVLCFASGSGEVPQEERRDLI